MTHALQLPDPTTDVGAALAVALAACDEADRLSLASFRQVIDIEAKAVGDYVTEADRAVERAIRTRILDRFPDDGLVGEEYGEEAAASARRWTIDPIDGTHNYMRGVPLFATLLALEIDGQPTVGVVSAPALGRRWLAWVGGGAWAVDLGPEGPVGASAARVSVSAIRDLDATSVVYSSVPSITGSGMAPGFLDLLAGVWRDRGLGDFYGYMLVAEGAADVMVESELMTWDVAGPRVVLLEAGARVSDLAGGESIPARGMLATNGHLHDTILDRLQGR